MSSRSQLQENFKNYTIKNTRSFEDKKDKIRIMTFNVHDWKDYLNINSINKIFQIITYSNSDVVGINEGFYFSNDTKNKLKEYSKNMGYNYFLECNSKYGINLLLSKHKIESHEIINLGKDPINKTTRYAIKATIQVNNKNINILLAHLDVWDESEETRLKQIKQILSDIDSSYLLLGDFNSLRLKDYSKIEWDVLKNDSELRNITIQHKVTDLIEKHKFVDSFEKINKVSPNVSVWSMRRVDYVYVGNNFPFTITNSNVFPTLVSDHYPIYIDIDLTTNITVI